MNSRFNMTPLTCGRTSATRNAVVRAGSSVTMTTGWVRKVKTATSAGGGGGGLLWEHAALRTQLATISFRIGPVLADLSAIPKRGSGRILSLRAPSEAAKAADVCGLYIHLLKYNVLNS